MSWSKCCYLYHKEKGGTFLGDAREAELILDHVGQPLTVNQYLPEGRYGVSRIQACVMVNLEGDFEMSISTKKRGGGLLSLLDDVAVAEGGEGSAQQQEGQQDHARHGGELTPVDAFHPPVTSNL